MSRSASCRAVRQRRKPARAIGSRRVSSVFAASDSAGTAPRPMRSSGTVHSPSARRSRAGTRETSRPSSQIVPAGARGSSPDSAPRSSPCPLPEIPATPRISPGRTSR